MALYKTPDGYTVFLDIKSGRVYNTFINTLPDLPSLSLDSATDGFDIYKNMKFSFGFLRDVWAFIEHTYKIFLESSQDAGVSLIALKPYENDPIFLSNNSSNILHDDYPKRLSMNLTIDYSIDKYTRNVLRDITVRDREFEDLVHDKWKSYLPDLELFLDDCYEQDINERKAELELTLFAIEHILNQDWRTNSKPRLENK